MVHFPTFLAIVFGGMEVIQPAAAGVLAGLTARIDLETVFQRRQATSSPPPTPAQCESTCESVAPIIESGVSHTICILTILYGDLVLDDLCMLFGNFRDVILRLSRVHQRCNKCDRLH
jgi:hypothetical protein